MSAINAAAGPPAERVAHATLRGAVAAMAMTGMRVCTIGLGIVEEPPPQAIFRQRAKGLLRLVPRKRRRATVELAHWSYGAAGGAALAADHLLYGLVLSEFRQRPRE